MTTLNGNRSAALARLLEVLPRGSNCYTIQRHRSRSGGTVVVSVRGSAGFGDFSREAAEVLGLRYDKRGGVRLACDTSGADPCFRMVAVLAFALHRDRESLTHIRL